MMLETSAGIRMEILGDPGTGGRAFYDSRDGAISGMVAFETLDVEIGAPVRYVWNDRPGSLDDLGEVVNVLIIRPRPASED